MKEYGRLAKAVRQRDAEIEEMAAEYVEKYGYSLTEAMAMATADLRHKRSQAALYKDCLPLKIKKVG